MWRDFSLPHSEGLYGGIVSERAALSRLDEILHEQLWGGKRIVGETKGVHLVLHSILEMKGQDQEESGILLTFHYYLAGLLWMWSCGSPDNGIGHRSISNSCSQRNQPAKLFQSSGIRLSEQNDLWLSGHWEENHGSTHPRSSFSISYKAGLVTVSSFHLSEKLFIFPSFLKDFFSQKWYFYLTIVFLSSLWICHSTTFLPIKFVMRNTLIILWDFPSAWWVNFILMLSISSTCLFFLNIWL